MVYTYKRILFNLKRKGILTHDATWMNLENIILSELSQTDTEDKYYMIPLTRGS